MGFLEISLHEKGYDFFKEVTTSTTLTGDVRSIELSRMSRPNFISLKKTFNEVHCCRKSIINFNVDKQGIKILKNCNESESKVRMFRP